MLEIFICPSCYVEKLSLSNVKKKIRTQDRRSTWTRGGRSGYVYSRMQSNLSPSGPLKSMLTDSFLRVVLGLIWAHTYHALIVFFHSYGRNLFFPKAKVFDMGEVSFPCFW